MRLPDPPVEISYDANAPIIHGIHGGLDIQLRNCSTDTPLRCDWRLTSRLLPGGASLKCSRLDVGKSRKHYVVFPMLWNRDHEGSAPGRALFKIVCDIVLDDDEKHRYSGEFTCDVLAPPEDHDQINLNLNQVGNQNTGQQQEKREVVETEQNATINISGGQSILDLQREHQGPKFDAIDLQYEGVVKEETSAIIKRDGSPLSRCSLVDEETDSRLLVLTGDSIVLGKNRQKADIVTWKMPRSDENDHETLKISGVQCRLMRQPDGVLLEHCSSMNPTLCNDRPVGESVRLSMDQPTALTLPAGFVLTVTPLPVIRFERALVDRWCEACGEEVRSAFDWSQNTGVGGVLVTRSDELAERERYLWLMSAVAEPDRKQVTKHTGLALVNLGGVAVTPAEEGVPVRIGEETVACGNAACIAAREAVTVGDVVFAATPWGQVLGV